MIDRGLTTVKIRKLTFASFFVFYTIKFVSQSRLYCSNQLSTNSINFHDFITAFYTGLRGECDISFM